MKPTVAVAALVFGVLGCDRGSKVHDATPPRASSAASRASGSASESRAPAVSSPPAREPLEGIELLRKGELTSVQRGSHGDFTGEVRSTPVILYVATTDEPLAPRVPVAFHGVASLIAPQLVMPTVFRRISLGALSRAANDSRTRRLLREKARVLADGHVRVAVALGPPDGAEQVDVADLSQGGTVWSWERHLMARDPIPFDVAETLRDYVSLLALDYLVGNLRRRRVVMTKERRLIASGDNDVFSSHDLEGAIKESLVRLARHRVFSREASRRLRAITVDDVNGAMAAGDDGALLVTPKQVREIMDRREALLRLLDERISFRGDLKALALP